MKAFAYAVFRNLPIYLIVVVLLIIALPKNLTSPQTTTNNQPLITHPAATVEKKLPDLDSASKGVADIARLTIDSTKEKYDSLKDLYEKLFSVITALGALFAFLGFKGADSFIQAKQKAEETLKKAESAQDNINKFLSEIYPKNNKAEVNVTTGIVLRHIADAYGMIIEKTNPKHDLLSDDDYKGFLNSALYYLDSVDEVPGIDDALRNRTASTKGNVYRRLGEYERAITVLEQRIKAGVLDDDSIAFNLGCYYTLKAQKEASGGSSKKAAEAENKALGYLSDAIRLNPENRSGALSDRDFEYFLSRKDQRFSSLVMPKEFDPCPMKDREDCPAKSLHQPEMA